MPQPPALDPEGLLLELALRRDLIGRMQAQAAVNAKASAGGRASIPDLLVRGGFLSSEVVAGLKAEVTAYLAQQRLVESQRPTPGPQPPLPPRYPPTPPGAQRRPGDSAFASRARAPALPIEEPPTVPGGLMSSSGATPARGMPRHATEALAASSPDGPTLPLQTDGDPPSTKRDASSSAATVNATRVDGSTRSSGFQPVVGAKFGRYELLSELGRGGMGIVFRARQADLEREVALKMLLDGGGASNVAVDRFYAEARHVAKLVHPGIVSIHDVGEHEGIHYFTMDFVEGQHLGHLIRAGEIDRKKAVEIAIKLCAALAYAHKQGVIHRDLKPGNVLMDRRGSPRITDFGIAKDLGKESTSTRAGEVLGTPNYMPPEQADGRALSVDARADVYSLGAVLYEMLTGRPPFIGDTTFEVVTQVVHQKPTPPRKLKPDIPVDLETIVLKCLEKPLESRYKDANALLKDLESFRDGEKITATRSSTLGRTLGGIGAHPVALTLALTGLLLAAGLGAYVIYLKDNEQSAQDKADAERRKQQEELASAGARAKEEEELRRAAEKGSALVKDAVEAEARDATALAMQKALAAVEAAPKLVLAHETLARFYLELRKDPEHALAEADAAIALDASALDARKTRARSLIAASRHDDALAEAEKIEALGPDAKGVPVAVRGEVALARGEGEKAAKELEQAQGLLPRDARVQLDLASA
ncbi:protein kinase, partial [bacterium]|nr:protein kinase [bacterium]